MYMKVVSPDDASKLSDLLKDGDWMVLYYAEWCGHCNAMKPEWEKFITKMKNPSVNSSNVKIADVKSDFITDLKNKPEIAGFPTIKMYSNGKEVADFKDDRVVENMVKFAQSNSNTKNTKSIEEVKSVKEAVVNVAAEPIQVPIQNTVPEPITKEELPMVNLNVEQAPSVNIVAHKSAHKSAPTHRVSSIKTSVKQLKMDNLLAMPVINNKSKKRSVSKKSIGKVAKGIQVPPVGTQMQVQTHTQNINVPCNQIRKAKFCKANPKCMFDYPGNKCVDKVALLPNKEKSLVSRKSVQQHKSSKAHTVRNSKRQSKQNIQNKNNIKKSTKEVFGELIKSFGRISNEAHKDAKLLKQASNKL